MKQENGKLTSPEIARALVFAQKDELRGLLMIWREISNPNCENFSKRIRAFLVQGQFDCASSHNRFMDISRHASPTTTTPSLFEAILMGFISHWESTLITYQEYAHIFMRSIPRLSSFGCRKYLHFLAHKAKTFSTQIESTLALADQICKSVLKKGKPFITLGLIHEFQLKSISERDIIWEMLSGSIQSEILFAFKDKQSVLNHQLVAGYISACQAEGKKKRVTSLIKSLKLKVEDYHGLEDDLIMKGIRYKLRTYPVFFVELQVNNNLHFLELLVRILMETEKRGEALNIVGKYHLNPEKLGLGRFEVEEERILLNPLIQHDMFAPTEQIFSKECDYLRLSQLGYQEKSVMMVDSKSIHTFPLEDRFVLDRNIGFDTESIVSSHTFDPQLLALVQIATNRRIYLFDMLSLKGHPRIKQVFSHIFINCNVYGHSVHKQVADLFQLCGIDLEVGKLHIYDVVHLFRTSYPKETKHNLALMCEMVLHRRLSKYEQCSGWHNRPLRRAQRHYAGLDAVVPLLVGQKIGK